MQLGKCTLKLSVGGSAPSIPYIWCRQMAVTIYLVSADGSNVACQAVAVLLTAPAQHRHSTGLATGLAACVAYYGIESGNVCKYRAAGGAPSASLHTVFL